MDDFVRSLLKLTAHREFILKSSEPYGKKGWSIDQGLGVLITVHLSSARQIEPCVEKQRSALLKREEMS